MASTHETGHAKNVANFHDLVAVINAHGDSYKPTKSSIQVQALQELARKCGQSISDVNSAIPVYKKAIAERDEAFSPLSKLLTKVKNSLLATDASKLSSDSVTAQIKKVQGVSASKKKIAEPTEGVTAEVKEKREISTSQMSFDNRLNNFDQVIKLLQNIPEYNPNEEDLKVQVLINIYENMKAKNSAVILATIPLMNSRTARNELLYNAEHCLYTSANDVKTYIKSVFGTSSPQYKQISKIKFSTYR